MATSGSASVAVTSYDTLKFSWSLANQSIADNTSTVTWKLELISGAYGAISSTASKNWSVTVNGTTYSGTNTVGIGNNATKILASGSTTIAHNSDGTKSFSYSFSQYFGITFSGSSVGTKAGSGSGTLTTIPRKSTLTVSDGTLGTAQTLTVTKKATSFTHTITYVSGEYSGTIATKSSATSISWTPPLTLATGAPYGTSVYVAFTIETFNGNTSIGTNSYAIWCSIPASIKPTVSFAVSDPLGYLSAYGAYVQGKSKFQIAVTASGSYGSNIASYKVEADGRTYSSASVETDVIASSGTLTISVTVTDSRGRTATASKTVTVLAYESPKITSMTLKRTDANGVSDSSGAYLTIVFDAQGTTLDGKNGMGYGASYKKTTESESNYVYEDIEAYKDAFSVDSGTFTFPADPSFSYDVILQVADNFIQVKKSGVGPSQKSLFSLLKKGLGFAFGKVAELEDTLEIAFETMFHKPATFKNTMAVYMENASGTKRNALHMNQSNALNLGYGGYVANEGVTNVYGNAVGFLSKNGYTFNGAKFADFIIETGEKDGWFYRKWNSGTAECWKKHYANGINASANNYSGFYYSSSILVSFPFTFVNYPTVIVDGGSSNYMNFVRVFGQYQDKASFVVVGLSNVSSADIIVEIRAIGKWK